MSARNTPRTPKFPSKSTITPISNKKPQRIRNVLNNSGNDGRLLNTAFSVESKGVRKRNHDDFQTPTSSGKRENPRYYFTPDCFTKVSMDATEKPAMKLSSGNEREPEVSNLTVAVRVRPMNKIELMKPSVGNIIHVEENTVTVLAGTTADSSAGITKGYTYDCAFSSCNSQHEDYADQKMIFDSIGAPLVDKAFEGYNVCLFAYGQTSSGKSYSMMGIDNGNCDSFGPNSEAGIIPRFCHELFRRIDAVKKSTLAEVEVSYFEIYNEKIHDLLSVPSTTINNTPNGRKYALRVREHADWGPYVVDLSSHPVDSYTSLKNWLIVGNSQRATATTGMNDKSSRSHSIFNIVLNISGKGDGSSAQQTRRSKISLVDLAGSERMNPTCASGDRLKEGISINKSLLTLGKVIAALASPKKGTFVPYRESVLTWLLKENLGGNSKTVMLATISPANIHLEETLATLRYASQARAIVNRVKVNENPHDKIIRELRAEVDRLQVLLQDHDRQRQRQVTPGMSPVRAIVIESPKTVNEQELEMLRKQLAQSKQELARAQKSWMDRLREAEAIRKTEMETLKRKGLALNTEISRKESCLVNLDSDPSLSGVMVFLLPPGKVTVGRNHPTLKRQPDIVLEGPLVALNHCTMENSDGVLFIDPISLETETYVNGRLIDRKTQLHHGDRVVFGGSHYFLVSNPRENVEMPPFDFQQAHQEITLEQEKRLREEIQAEMDSLQLEMVKMKAKKEVVESELEIFKTQVHSTPSREAPEGGGYKFNLVDHLQRLMTHPSDDCLHEIQMHVKEATQRCKDVGAKEIEFMQSQICDEFGLFRAVVNIVDRKNRRVAEWPPARLDVWLENMRTVEEVEPDQIFDCMEIEWKAFDGMNENILNESLKSGKRISLNLSRSLGKTSPLLQKSPRIKSALRNITPTAQKRLFTEAEVPDENTPVKIPGDFSAKAQIHLKNLHMTTTCLRNLCHEDNSSNKSQKMLKFIDQVDHLVAQMTLLTTKEQDSENNIPKTPKSVRFRLD